MLGAARQSGSPEVALAAAAGLAGLGDEAALTVVAEALASGEPAQRAEAVLVLGKLAEKGSRAARVELGRLSSDEDERVRTRAATALRQAYFGDPLRARRTRGSLVLASVATILLAGALLALRRGGRAG
jgi:HEAT repeat protein